MWSVISKAIYGNEEKNENLSEKATDTFIHFIINTYSMYKGKKIFILSCQNVNWEKKQKI